MHGVMLALYWDCVSLVEVTSLARKGTGSRVQSGATGFPACVPRPNDDLWVRFPRYAPQQTHKLCSDLEVNQQYPSKVPLLPIHPTAIPPAWKPGNALLPCAFVTSTLFHVSTQIATSRLGGVCAMDSTTPLHVRGTTRRHKAGPDARRNAGKAPERV